MTHYNNIYKIYIFIVSKMTEFKSILTKMTLTKMTEFYTYNDDGIV
jgi:hypothetical protein